MFKSHTFTLCAVLMIMLPFIASSCGDDADKVEYSRFTVSTIGVDLISTGQFGSGESATFTVLANNGYTITSDSDWLSVDKPEGKGRVNVTILADRYDTGSGRTGHLTVTSGDRSETVTVNQTATPFPAYGYAYFTDDFSWLIPYATAFNAGDFIATADPGANAPNIGGYAASTKPEEKDLKDKATALLQEISDRGYTILRPADNTVYLQAHYFKIGKSNKNNGFILPSLDLAETSEESTSVSLSFDFAAHMTGKLYIDQVRIVVEVQGDGEIALNNGGYGKISDQFVPDQKDGEAKWTRATVKIYGVTSGTKISLRPADMDNGTNRWHLDNISIVKIPGK